MKVRRGGLVLNVVAGLSFASCSAPATRSATEVHSPLGETKASAIEVCMPAGERAYLSRLICPSGAPPKFSRSGSYGPRTELPRTISNSQMDKLLDQSTGAPLKPGEKDHHVIDGYSVDCEGKVVQLFLDMYHCDAPATNAAPSGFTLRPSP